MITKSILVSLRRKAILLASASRWKMAMGIIVSGTFARPDIGRCRYPQTGMGITGIHPPICARRATAIIANPEYMPNFSRVSPTPPLVELFIVRPVARVGCDLAARGFGRVKRSSSYDHLEMGKYEAGWIEP